jgi:RHH-type proline utilization regulon transcriptional repressor/proline dehydrogenase/delta 1-pyrroline-5-carboxylate dehydrogenase
MDLGKISKNSFVKQEDFIKTISSDLTFEDVKIKSIKKRARKLIDHISKDEAFAVEKFLQEYSLSEEEGIAIMCLAESLIRVPDYKIAFDLSTDKLEGKDWSKGKNKNILMQIASIGLSLSSKFVGFAKGGNLLQNLVNKVSAPIFVTILKRAIKLFSSEFILAENVSDALKQTSQYKDYRFAFDLLGESARNFTQSDIYYKRYLEAIELLGRFYPKENDENIFHRPNLSVKFTSLYPRFELTKYEDIKRYLMRKLLELINKMA